MRHPELFEPPYDASYARRELRRGSIGPIVYGVAVPITAVAPLLAPVLYLSIAVLYAITNQGTSAEAA